MAGNIKGITIEFNGDTTKLDKALRQIQNNTKSLDRELKQVDKALKFNPTNVELWRQKQQLLTQKVDETKKKLDALKQSQAQMDAQGVDKNSEEYRKLQREIIVTENQAKTFEGQLKKIGNVNLRAASEQVKEMGNKLTQAGEAMRGLSMAAAGVVASLGAAAYKAGQNADDLNTLSKVYSMSTTDLQKYKVAADLVDVSVEDIAKSHVKLEKSMYSAQNGSSTMTEAFDKLGVSIYNSDGTLRNSDEVWQETISKLGQMTNETERDALAMQLMGKSAANLNPLIEDNGETYKNLSDTLSKYGLDFVDQETLDKANQFNDELDTMKAIGSVALATVGSQLASSLAPALEKVVDLVGRFANWLSNLDPAILTTIGVIAGVVAAIAPVLMFLGKLSFAISSIMSLASTIGPMLGALAGPVGIVIGVIAALVAVGVLLYKNWDTIKAKAQELWANVQAVFSQIGAFITGIWNGIKAAAEAVWNAIVAGIRFRIMLIKTVVTTVFNAIKTVVTTVWNGIKNAITNPIQTAVNLVRNAINKIKSIVNGARLSLPKFKLPHFHISGGKLPWGIGGKGTPPKINVDWYAEGGIFDRASLIGVGEAGSEAVVPLDRFWKTLEDMQTGETNIVININGADRDPQAIAEEVKRMLIRETNQRRLAWQ